MNHDNDTIAAIATGSGGAIAIVRVSGAESHAICDRMFRAKSGATIAQTEGYSLLYGTIEDEHRAVVDDVLISVFRNPKSYTGEDMVEISCHGSTFIKREILRLLVLHGARLAQAGEFTIRAFLAGKMDLSQAEAVADTIAAADRASHALASNQMRGGYSAEFSELRQRLIHIVSLLELELDFGEEDVEFADRSELISLLEEADKIIESLESSFELGNAIKEGVPVAIVGTPNVGKSTLLNALLKDDRAMVSDIEGTTRDAIEERLIINGIMFRFIDTAGIRDTDDALEKMGIGRTFDAASKARIILLLVDGSRGVDTIESEIRHTLSDLNCENGSRICLIINKTDLLDDNELLHVEKSAGAIAGKHRIAKVINISARRGDNIDILTQFLHSAIDIESICEGASVVTNSRHWEALNGAHKPILRAHTGMKSGLSGDFITQDIREAIHNLGLITGEITTTEILKEIFSKFCIGK